MLKDFDASDLIMVILVSTIPLVIIGAVVWGILEEPVRCASTEDLGTFHREGLKTYTCKKVGDSFEWVHLQ